MCGRTTCFGQARHDHGSKVKPASHVKVTFASTMVIRVVCASFFVVLCSLSLFGRRIPSFSLLIFTSCALLRWNFYRIPLRNNAQFRNCCALLRKIIAQSSGIMRNNQTWLRNNAQLDCAGIPIVLRNNAQLLRIITSRLRNNAQWLRNLCETVAQHLRNIDCAKSCKLRNNAQRCAIASQQCAIAQCYAGKSLKS